MKKVKEKNPIYSSIKLRFFLTKNHLFKQKYKGLEEFWKEVELISKLRPHSNIVQFFGICLNPLCVVYEFMAKGDLRHYLDEETNQIEKQQMMKWINQISIGKSKKKIILFLFLFHQKKIA